MYRYLHNDVQSNLHLMGGEMGCCDDAGTPCKYSLDYEADGTTITAITFKDKNGDSVTHTITPAINEDDPIAIIKAIEAAFAANGIGDDGVKPSINVWKETLGAGPDDYITIEIFGTVEVTNLVRASDATNAFVQACDKVSACRYKFAIDEGADIDLVIDDVVLEDPQSIADLDATTATDAPLVAEDLHTALDALYGDDFKRVKVTYNEVTAQYEIQFWLRDRANRPLITIEAEDAIELTKCECQTDFE
jgi:hypothetical protein